ncbi:MAG: hypothetical protein ABID83_02645 [Candidatus Omnitrophota bacterium]
MKKVACVLFFLAALAVCAPLANSDGTISMENGMGVGLPLGGGAEEADLELCPQGVRVVGMFFGAWQNEDYRAMYELLDDESKQGYPFEQARLDFQFLKFKEYGISSIKKSGGNFEFFLSYGDWKDGNKDMKKMIISGKTFKIIMPTKNSPFKESVDNYF